MIKERIPIIPMQINLNQLRDFFLVAKEKSVTKAAEMLFVTQPAVTMQIKSLETSLEMKLFRKSGKYVELTEAGEALFIYTEKMFGIVEEMEHVISRYSDISQGYLTIGTTRSFARYLMPNLLSRFQDKFPNVKVALKVGSSKEIADNLMEFKYDLGVIGQQEYNKKLKVITYSKEKFSLVVSPEHRFAEKKSISLKELKNESIIIREEGASSRHAILSMLRNYKVNPSVLIEAGSVEFIKEYVIRGHGLSFLYVCEIEQEIELGLLRSLHIKEGPLLLQTVITFPRNLELSSPAKEFLKLIAKERERNKLNKN